MIYPDNFEIKIGFDVIRQQLLEICASNLGRSHVNRMQFLTRHDLVQKLLNQVNEFRQILNSGVDFPSTHYYDVTAALTRAEIPGTFLEVRDFFQIKMSLQTIDASLRFFRNAEPEQYPSLRLLGQEIYPDRAFIKRLDKVVDDNGAVRDDATPELLWFKREIISQQGLLRKQISSVLKQAKADGYVIDDAEPTIRNGRIVIPVLAEHKRKIKGLIHDESATGQTVFIEPESIFERNNDIKDLENAYHRELIKLLTQLTNQLRPLLPDMKKAYQFLGLLDFIQAKATMAVRMEAILPQVHKNQTLSWKQARHPVLEAALKKQQRSVVPLDIFLNPEQRILLISGPNAGGKSVTLKTVGLLQYMLQCGLLIPVADGAQAGIFHDILLDIGDEQSIENDLSTYSSHLRNMNHFVRFADKKSLILIDEFGTGTEPLLGGAIAEAVLERMHKNQAWGVITTHYTNLKNYAERTKGVVNAAMRYDHENLQPLYKLETGKPGSSFAIEIARKIGLPQDILQRAVKLVGHDKIKYDRLLEELQVEKVKLEDKLRAAALEEKRLKESANDYAELKKFLEDSKQQTLREAKQEAKLILKQANQQIEQTIRTIQQEKADKDKTKQARENLKTFEETIAPEPLPVREPVEKGSIKTGDLVSLPGQHSAGEVLSVKGNKAEVLFGGIKSYVKLEQLEKVSKGKLKQKQKEAGSGFVSGLSSASAISQRMMDFSTQLDVRGMRAEEALTKVMSFIDDAVMMGMGEVKIVHGKGTGILRHQLRDYLRTVTEVASVASEHADRGGDGATVVVLK